MCNPVCLEVLGDLWTVCGDAPTILNLKGNKFSRVMKPVEAYKVAPQTATYSSPAPFLFYSPSLRARRAVFKRTPREVIALLSSVRWKYYFIVFPFTPYLRAVKVGVNIPPHNFDVLRSWIMGSRADHFDFNATKESRRSFNRDKRARDVVGRDSRRGSTAYVRNCLTTTSAKAKQNRDAKNR